MALADEMRRLIDERADRNQNLAFAGEGFRLDLNPIEDHWDQAGFILWADDGQAAPRLAAAGRALPDGVRVDGAEGYDGSQDDLLALLGRLLAAGPAAVGSPGFGGEAAIPTGGINDGPGWPTTADEETGDRR